METFSLLVAIGLAGTAFAMAPTQERQDLIDGRVSPQGMLVEGQGRTSPRGTTRLQVMPIEGGLQTLVSTLRITDRNGSVHLLPRVRGNAFFVTDLESIVVLEAYDSNAVPTRMTVIDFDGRGLFTQRVRVMTDPSLSNDGQFLAYRSIEGVVVLDLDTFETTLHPLLDLFAAGPDGLLAGVLPGEGNVVTFLDGQSETAAVHLPARPIRMAFSEDGSALLLLTSRELLSVMLDSGRSRTLYRSPADRELRDLLSQGVEVEGAIGRLPAPGDAEVVEVRGVDLIERGVFGAPEVAAIASPLTVRRAMLGQPRGRRQQYRATPGGRDEEPTRHAGHRVLRARWCVRSSGRPVRHRPTRARTWRPRSWQPRA